MNNLKCELRCGDIICEIKTLPDNPQWYDISKYSLVKGSLLFYIGTITGSAYWYFYYCKINNIWNLMESEKLILTAEDDESTTFKELAIIRA